MFKRSKNKQGDMFKDMSMLLSSRKQELLNSQESWHNIMWRDVVSKIDEHPYSVLYASGLGRPNASIRVLIGMMILKEGNGWSDEQLYESCRFNIKVMHALGLRHIDDDVPVESTYYEFRRLLGTHMERTGEDLLKATFQQVTAHQALKYGVSGKKIRMDSKLINSNIATSNRIHLILETLRNYVKVLTLETYRREFQEEDFEFLEVLQQKKTNNITYGLNSSQKALLLKKLGSIIGQLLKVAIIRNSAYNILKQVFEEQYEVKSDESDGTDEPNGSDMKGEQEEEIQLRSPKQISSDTIQSAHDPQARYRVKGQDEHKQTVSGFHGNVVESCSQEDKVNLILDVDTTLANVSEDSFLITGKNNAQEVLDLSGDKSKQIEEVIADGGYDSIENRSVMLQEDQPQLSIMKMKGNTHRYEMEFDEEQNLQVTDLKDGTPCNVKISPKTQKYVITSQDGEKRYLTKQQIDNYIIHQQIKAQVNDESYNLRASAESTIHQVFHRLKKGNKMVYRGLIRCQWYVLSRAFWVNLTRISQKELENTLIFVFLGMRAWVLCHIPQYRKIQEPLAFAA